MDPEAIALLRELADRSPSERKEYFAQHKVPEALRVEVESVLRFDGETTGTMPDRVAAIAADLLLHDRGTALARERLATPTGETGPPDGLLLASETGEGRFPAGTLLGERYRIVTLLGRGGMGEVYRATDLKLRQPVALKFLPEAMARDHQRRARLHGEVRLARQISHPNVCRVYDINEVDGAAFISMEYIDGEDLASLLRRIGRLPHDKALEIARRLCAGLAAAHDKGVLHRDLKPSNIMIDGRGQVFITDFGLAATARDLKDTAIRSGTPAYMAPEQLEGREVSVRSDLYAIGLILYEMFSGRRAFDRARQAGDRPPRLSAVARDLDPTVARAIDRCLETDPRDRPASALAVAAALPGGNPLAEAMAAGLTPSPQMVAASGEGAAITVRAALMNLAFIAIGLVAVVALDSRVSILRLTPFENPPDVLSQMARETIASLGYTDHSVDRASGLFWAGNYQRYAERRIPVSEYREQLARGQPPLIFFWYRQSAQYLLPANADRLVSLDEDPPLATPGEVFVWIDPQGRLLQLRAVPSREDYSTQPDRPGNWDALFAASGVDRSRFVPVEPSWIPPVTFDDRAAWTGSYAHAPSVPMRIEAASWKGRPVYFRLIGPWTVFQTTDNSQMPSTTRVALGVIIVVSGLLIAAGGFVAWRNYRLGKGDLQGASRLAAVTLVCALLSWLVTAHHVPTLFYYRSVLLSSLGPPLYFAAIAWGLYVAIEPYMRRRWPQSLITWTRVLAGRIRDPLVGGHVLIGTALGVGVAIWVSAESWASLGEGTVLPRLDFTALQGAGWALNSWLWGLVASIGSAQALLLLFLIARVLLRREWAAGAAFVIIVCLPDILDSTRPVTTAFFEVPSALLALWTLTRLGVLPMIVASFVSGILVSFPLTTDLSAWYSEVTLFALATVLALAIWSFRVALAGRPLIGDVLLEPTR
jgi:predicted Ser/Thr protein kinase